MNASQLFQESKEYLGFPSKIAYGESSKNATPKMNIAFSLVDENHQPTGHEKSIELWLTEKAIDRTMGVLVELGFTGTFEDPKLTPLPAPVKLECRHEEYNGKVREKWSFWGNKESQPLARDQAAAWNAKFKQLAPPSKVPPTGKPTPPPAAKVPSAPPKSGPPTVNIPPKEEEKIVATDEASAWDYWLNNSTAGEAKCGREWTEAMNEQGRKPQTAKEWNKFALLVEIPF